MATTDAPTRTLTPVNRSSRPSPPAGAPHEPATGATLTRWMWVWITIAILVVLVVVGFLLGIAAALESIDDNLADAAGAVVNVEGDVEPLPAHIERINDALTEIDDSLEPIEGQADDIIAPLSAIVGSLEEVDASLETTSGTLGETSGTLGDVSDVLERVLSLAGDVESSIASAQSRESMGTNLIWRNVADANDVLESAESDTGNILTELGETNEHLDSICEALPTPGPC